MDDEVEIEGVELSVSGISPEDIARLWGDEVDTSEPWSFDGVVLWRVSFSFAPRVEPRRCCIGCFTEDLAAMNLIPRNQG